jgi:TPR repeat protein
MHSTLYPEVGRHVVPKSDAQAVYLWQASAEVGYTDAEVDLGLCYDRGLGVPPSIETAIRWYSLAAMKGHGIAQNNLVSCFLQKRWVSSAMFWARIAATSDCADAEMKAQHMSFESAIKTACANCKTLGPKLLCRNCKVVLYCSAQCAATDSAHTPDCANMQRTTEARKHSHQL